MNAEAQATGSQLTKAQPMVEQGIQNQTHKNLRVVLVDDEPLARQGLRIRLAQVRGITIVGEAENGRQALERIAEHKPDVVLMDIQMPGIDGLGVVDALCADPRLLKSLPYIIFVTAYDEYAVKAFAAEALDYLLKPVDEERLQEAIERARKMLKQRHRAEQQKQLRKLLARLTGQRESELGDPRRQAEHLAKLTRPKKLVFKDGHTILRIEQEDIRWIEAAGDYMCVQTGQETHVVRTTMKKIEADADPAILQRVHRSTMVNVQRIKSLEPHSNGEYFLTLESGKQVKLSRHYRDKLEQLQQ